MKSMIDRREVSDYHVNFFFFISIIIILSFKRYLSLVRCMLTTLNGVDQKVRDHLPLSTAVAGLVGVFNVL